MKLKQGFIQIYTGNGKGKTTAAIGQALRALGFGLNIYFVQFMKNHPYGEVKLLESFAPQLVLKRYGNDAFVFQKKAPSAQLISEVQQGLLKAQKALLSGCYDMVILDEILVAIYFKLIQEDQIKKFLKKKPPRVEIILTGRYSPPAINDLADLVTEMKEIKHYYRKGILARRGIES